MNHPSLQLYNYHKWANNKIFHHLRELPDDVYGKELKSVFPSVQIVLQHIYQTDGMWLSVMSGDDFSQTMEKIRHLKEKSENKTLSEIENVYDDLNQQFRKFLTTHPDPDQNMTIHHPKYGELDTTVSKLTSHVVNHGTYHRGNITAMLRQQGYTGVSTDYIFYLYNPEEII